MGQYHIVVNLSKKECIDPYKFKDGIKLMDMALSGEGTMFALAWLLENDWNGDYITIAGDYGVDTDFDPELLKHLGIKLGHSTVYDVASAVSDGAPKLSNFKYSVKDANGNRVTKTDTVGWKTSKLFTDVSEQTIEKIVASGVAVFEDTGHGLMRFGKVKRNASTSFSIIVNEDNGEALDPRVFGDSARLLSFAREHAGGTMSALAVLLASACKGGARGGGDIRLDTSHPDIDMIGSWSGCRISIKPRKELKYTKDISEKMRGILEEAGHVKYSHDGSKVTRDWA